MAQAEQAARPGALSHQQLLLQRLTFPDYRTPAEAPASRFAAAAERLWGGRLTPMMAASQTRGRFAAAPLACPPTACTGAVVLPAGARAPARRNPEAIECIVCIEGEVQLRYGPELAGRLTLGRFDMASVPEDVRFEWANTGLCEARLVTVLSIKPEGGYDTVFDNALADAVPAEAARALGARFDGARGRALETGVMEGRVTRFEKLVPYKKDLQRTDGLPPEATEKLSAGNVFPLIVPMGHSGRSRTAPVYGNQGLYIAIAECRCGDDGPPPHVHSETQESFYVLDGSFEMYSGFDNESMVQAWPNDLIAMPKGIMRAFRNTADKPARLLVIIQGPDRMNDTVSLSRRIGDEFEKRFGAETIEAYARIHVTFDAEERLQT